MQSLQNLADSLSRRLKCAVAIDDNPMGMLVHSAIHGHLDQARIVRILSPERDPDPAVRTYVRSYTMRWMQNDQPKRIPAKPELGVDSRMYMPLRIDGEWVGAILVFDPDYKLTESDFPDIVKAAETASEVIRRERVVWDPNLSQEQELLQAVLSEDAGQRTSAGQVIQDTGLLPPAGAVVVLLGSYRDSAWLGDSTRRQLQSHFEELRGSGQALVAINRAQVQVLLAIVDRDPDQARVANLAQRLHDMLTSARKDSGEGTALVASGGPQPNLDCAWLSFSQAEQALQAARTLPQVGSVVDWCKLGIYRLLLQLPPDLLSGAQVEPGLLRLINQHPDLTETLDCYLETAGHSLITARRLFIHRATLHYRLRRIEEITGTDLGSGEDRLQLHLGLKIAALAGIYRPAMASPAESQQVSV